MSECQFSEFSEGIDDSDVDGDLLDEWDDLTQRERAIESCLNSIEDAIYQVMANRS